MANQSVVTQAFLKGKGPKVASNYFWEDRGDGNRVLYSFGRHFPLAIYHNNLFVVNGDRYSVTTSAQQSTLQSALRGENSITTSLSALTRATEFVASSGIIPAILSDELKVVDYNNETYKDYALSVPFDEAKIPAGARPYYHKDPETGEIHCSGYHLPAQSLFHYRGKSFICGMDEQSYFVSVLPKRAKSVTHAFEILKPKRIKQAEAQGIKVKRQGEWFSIPYLTGREAKKTYRKMQRGFIFPGEGNIHRAARGMTRRRQILWSGSLRHPEHRTLRVSKATAPEVWQAICNTALVSFSATGVD